MTGMEQSLRYIEREIRFMVKDQFGNATNAKFADRVIEDACGIPNFCSTVLSSKKPLTAILRVVRGARGDVIIKFFNASLHDARIEMVMVLAEATKLRIHRNKTSRDAHEYLMKLYRKAIKRIVRLITGSKNKESYKSMYRGLRDFAHMDDYDYDDYDDDDEYFDDTDFGDSEFAEECLDAYRNGRIPPEMNPIKAVPGSTNTLIDMAGNEEILKEIASIEAKLGRHLTDAELDTLLCGDDDDDEESHYPKSIIDNSEYFDDIADKLTNIIYERLIKKLNGEESPKISPFIGYGETLDDFLEKSRGIKPSNGADLAIDESANLDNISKEGPEGVSAIPKKHVTENSDDASLEKLVGMHNQLKNQIHKEDEIDSESDEETNCLPPNESLGGTSDEINTSSDNIDIDDLGEPDNDKPIAKSAELEPKVEHAMISDDIIRDFVKVEDDNISLSHKLTNYLNQIGIDFVDVFTTLRPSISINHLLTLAVTIRVSGDYEIIDATQLNLITDKHISEIAGKIDISEDLIDTEFNVIDTNKQYKDDLARLNDSNVDKFTPYNVNCINIALCAILKYIYSRINTMYSVKFICPLNGDKLKLYFFNKDGTTLDNEFSTFIIKEMLDEEIISKILREFEVINNISKEVEYFISENSLDKVFCETLTKELSSQKIKDIISAYSDENDYYLTDSLVAINKPPAEVSSEFSFATGNGNVVIDNMHRIITTAELSRDEKSKIKDDISINGEYRIQLRDMISAISSNVDVCQYLLYKVEEPDDEETEESSEDESSTESKTSNFGI